MLHGYSSLHGKDYSIPSLVRVRLGHGHISLHNVDWSDADWRSGNLPTADLAFVCILHFGQISIGTSSRHRHGNAMLREWFICI